MTADPEQRDPGQYIGSEPELASEKIPGGVRPDDQRVAAHSTQVVRPANQRRRATAKASR